MNPVVRRALLAVAALAALALPASASAHANLVATRPADGAVLAAAPAAVRVTFDDDVRPGQGIAAIRNGGGSVLRGSARIAGGTTLVVPLRRGLGDGDYSVRWAIVSDDGHFESGVVAFAVGAGRAPPRAALVPLAEGPDASTVLARWVFLGGVLGAAGIALFALVVLHGRLDQVAAERIALVLVAGAVLAAAGAGSELHRVGLGTRDGAALAAGFVAAVAVATLAAAATLERRALPPALLLAPVLVAVPAVAGHALDPGLARVNVAADVLHVGAAAAWTGVLLGLLVLPADAIAVRRASALALAALVVLGVTGVLRASYELRSAAQLWDTGYGRALLVKTGLLAALLVLGRLAGARLRRGAWTELVLLAALLAAVAVLVQLRPGRDVPARGGAGVTAPGTTRPPR
jgi:copper transport protein